MKTACRSQSVERVAVEPAFMIAVPAPGSRGVGIQPGTGTAINTLILTGLTEGIDRGTGVMSSRMVT
jgi:hypothetical protein